MIDNTAVFRDFSWNSALPDEVPAGHIHLWAVPLDGRDSSGLVSSLPDNELQRADRFAFAKDRCRFIQSHAFLRRVLARYVKVPPSEIDFAYGAQGKPSFADRFRYSGLAFNLSHCDRAALVAVAAQVPVGADVEDVRAMPDCLSLARRFFARQEYATLAGLPEAERCSAFFRCWTRKEAVVKALGLGLMMPLHSFEVTLSAELPASIVSFEPGSPLSEDWSLIHVEPLDHVIGAVAVPLSKAVVCGFLLPD